MIPTFGFDFATARYIAEDVLTGAANGMSVDGNAVPAGRVWLVIAASCARSASLSRTFFWSKRTRTTQRIGLETGVTAFDAVDLVACGVCPLILFASESLRFTQTGAAPADGSQLTLRYTFIEIAVPALRGIGGAPQAAPPAADAPVPGGAPAPPGERIPGGGILL